MDNYPTKYMVKQNLQRVSYFARDDNGVTWSKSLMQKSIANELLDRLDWTIDYHTNELTSNNMRISLSELTERQNSY